MGAPALALLGWPLGCFLGASRARSQVIALPEAQGDCECSGDSNAVWSCPKRRLPTSDRGSPGDPGGAGRLPQGAWHSRRRPRVSPGGAGCHAPACGLAETSMLALGGGAAAQGLGAVCRGDGRRPLRDPDTQGRVIFMLIKKSEHLPGYEQSHHHLTI